MTISRKRSSTEKSNRSLRQIIVQPLARTVARKIKKQVNRHWQPFYAKKKMKTFREAQALIKCFVDAT